VLINFLRNRSPQQVKADVAGMGKGRKAAEPQPQAEPEPAPAGPEGTPRSGRRLPDGSAFRVV